MAKIIIPFTTLPEAKDWQDGETYDISIKQISSDGKAATFEVIGEEDDTTEGDRLPRGQEAQAPAADEYNVGE